MARTPSMTVEDCELALGPRGELRVTADNKAMVRKWCSAKGLPGAYSATLAYAQLAGIYNVKDDSRLNFHKGQAALQGKTGDADMAESTDTSETASNAGFHAVMDAVTLPAITDKPAIANDGSAGATLAGLVAPYIADSVESMVMAKLDAKLASVSITRIEMVRPDNTVHTIEGHIHSAFTDLLMAMNSRMANGFHPNVLVVGPTGSGKSHGVEMAAKAMGLSFHSNGALTMDHQLLGWKDATGNFHSCALRDAYTMPAVWCSDELDGCDNSPLLCAAAALANGHQQFGDGKQTRHIDSVFVATANTWGLGATNDFVGRNKLDGMILSRFPVRIYWDYDESLELAISGNPTWAKRIQRARAKARSAGLKVTIDPRMTQAGAALIAAGATSEKAASMTYLANLTPEQRRIVDSD